MKIFNTILAALILPVCLSAQISIGPKAGLALYSYNLSTELNNQWDVSMKLGFHAGVAVDIPFGMFGLQIEALYLQKGGNWTSEEGFILTDGNGNPIDIGIYESTLSTSYLEIPMLLKYHFRGKTFGGFLMAGPQLGFGLSGKASDRFVGQTQDITADDVELDFGSSRNDYFKSSDFSLAFGAGFFYELDFGKIIVDGRYVAGLSNVRNSSNAGDAFKNRGLMFSVGYLFPLGGYW